jgi:hypothetical protein
VVLFKNRPGLEKKMGGNLEVRMHWVVLLGTSVITHRSWKWGEAATIVIPMMYLICTNKVRIRVYPTQGDEDILQ